MPPPPKPSTPLILVHGDDDFAVKKRCGEWLEQWTQTLDQPDQEIIDGQAANSSEALQSIGRLREAINTLPFFGGTKMVWWRSCSFLGDDRTSASQVVTQTLSELAQELKTFPWEKVRLLISAPKIDKRKVFFKTVDKVGATESFPAWTAESKTWQQEAEAQALAQLTQYGFTISDHALAELTTNVGPHRPQLTQEVEKLMLYAGNRKALDLSDVRAVVTRNKQAQAFALGDALGDRDLPRLLRTLDEELWEMQFDRRKSEIGLLYGLISKVRMMILLKELQREKLIQPTREYQRFKTQLENLPQDRLPEDPRFNPSSMNPYPLFRALQQARHYSLEELIQAMSLLLACNQRLIFSSLQGSLILQQTLVQIVQRQPTAPPPAHH